MQKWKEDTAANFGYVRLTNGMHLSLNEEPNVSIKRNHYVEGGENPFSAISPKQLERATEI